jgi:hypothetical protein
MTCGIYSHSGQWLSRRAFCYLCCQSQSRNRPLEGTVHNEEEA